MTQEYLQKQAYNMTQLHLIRWEPTGINECNRFCLTSYWNWWSSSNVIRQHHLVKKRKLSRFCKILQKTRDHNSRLLCIVTKHKKTKGNKRRKIWHVKSFFCFVSDRVRKTLAAYPSRTAVLIEQSLPNSEHLIGKQLKLYRGYRYRVKGCRDENIL